MLSPSSFLIFLLPFSIERERQYIYSTHKYLWKRSAEICVTARKNAATPFLTKWQQQQQQPI
jgi:hypothetical protein